VSIAAHGIGVTPPRGWDARIYARPRMSTAPSPKAGLPGFDGEPQGHLGTMHAASFPLTGAEGDFGADATIRMPDHGAFISLIEYQPDEDLVPGVGLFESREIPRALDADEFRREAMMVPRRSQAGAQRFFTVGERPFCLYAVIGSRHRAPALVAQINDALASLVIA
jgi:hypothetical protein